MSVEEILSWLNIQSMINDRRYTIIHNYTLYDRVLCSVDLNDNTDNNENDNENENENDNNGILYFGVIINESKPIYYICHFIYLR